MQPNAGTGLVVFQSSPAEDTASPDQGTDGITIHRIVKVCS